MRKIVVTIVSVPLILSLTGFIFAAEQNAPKSKLGVTDMEMISKQSHHVTGRVTAVDAAAKIITIKDKKGEVMLAVSDGTTFAKGKTLADVKIGDKLTVIYLENGPKKMALKVMTKGEMKEIKKKEKE